MLAPLLADRPAGIPLAGDWVQHFLAARALVDGHDPYALVRAVPGMGWPFDHNYAYPLTAAVVALPFALVVPAQLGAALFAGVGTALLAYGVTARAWWPLWLFASNPAITAVALGQFSPLLMGAALLPPFAGLLTIKPSLGLALWVYRPVWRSAVIGGLALAAVAFALEPAWPAHWLAALRTNPVAWQLAPPIARPGGAVLLLAALRWRRPEARLLLALACVPTTLVFYDQLALFLVARRWWQAAGLAALTFALREGANAWIAARPLSPAAQMDVVWAGFLLLLYLPCLAMVLARPNAGPLPRWAERATVRLPRWLRGVGGAPAPVGGNF